jgi:hypothetical protein
MTQRAKECLLDSLFQIEEELDCPLQRQIEL